MKRLTLLVALLLLVPAQVLAECAWMVWHETETTLFDEPRTSREWRLAATVDTRQECEARLTELAEGREFGQDRGGLKFESRNVQRGPGILSYTELTTWKGKPKEMLKHTRYCLPYTVDPRGKEGR